MLNLIQFLRSNTKRKDKNSNMKIKTLPKDFIPFCVDYNSLKDKMRSPFNEEHESEFITLFEHELKKVISFIKIKQDEMNKNSEELEVRSKHCDISDEVDKMKNELRSFVEYVRINAYLLERALKKHDKNTRYLLRPMYRNRIRLLSTDAEKFDDLFYRISKISLTIGKNEIRKTGSCFIRKTSKYWVPKKNVNAIKSMIVKHLPIYVHESAVDFDSMDRIHGFQKNNFNSRSDSNTHLGTVNTSNMSSSVLNQLDKSESYEPNNFNSKEAGNGRKPGNDASFKALKSPFHAWDNRFHDTCVSSVYLDNINFDLYRGRLHKMQGAEAIRIRWYTSKEQEIVFIERKQHQESWTGEQSAKLRFNIPERCVNDYILGKNVWKEVEKTNPGDIETTFVLYTEIQNAIIRKNLRPVLRTFYKRSAFQLPNDQRIRISLDTNLCMIREFSEIFTNWRRLDFDCEYPFRNLENKEIVRFPHAVLEVKIQGDTQPVWVDEIVSGYYVEPVDNFSKYMHGCAVLYSQIVDIPYWLPQCHFDISKDPVSQLSELNSIRNQTPTSVASSRLEIHDVEDRRISVPIRVEPKVFFANERTFLSWLHYSIFIGTFGTAMVGFSGDHRALYCGIIFIITSIIFALYALYLYLWRAGMIRSKDPGPYDDLYGPIALTLIFLCAMLLSLYFKLQAK